MENVTQEIEKKIEEPSVPKKEEIIKREYIYLKVVLQLEGEEAIFYVGAFSEIDSLHAWEEKWKNFSSEAKLYSETFMEKTPDTPSSLYISRDTTPEQFYVIAKREFAAHKTLCVV